MKKIFFLLLVVSCIFSCKSPAPSSDSVEPPGLMLRFSDPVTFELESDGKNPINLGVGINFYEDKVRLDKTEKEIQKLPLYCILFHQDSLVKDKKFELVIKGKKEWEGDKTANPGERSVKTAVLSGLELPEGKYKFKLYANTDSEENITGISKVMLFREKVKNQN